MLQVMFKNYWTTIVGAALAGLYYLDTIGTKMPATGGEWLHVAVGVGLAVLGFVAKSATTGSMPTSVKVLACALVLGGCATVQSDVAKAVTDMSTFTQADLDQAIAMAVAAKDAEAPYRARCYLTLKKYVPGGSTVGQALLPKGAVSAFETAAELDQQARGGVNVPQDLRADCAILLISAQEFALRLGAKFAPVPGAAAFGGVLR